MIRMASGGHCVKELELVGKNVTGVIALANTIRNGASGLLEFQHAVL
jgi:hypothetical protein